VLEKGTASDLSIWFFVSLALAIGGAVSVLIFAPKAPHKPAEKLDVKAKTPLPPAKIPTATPGK
jgi:hypothetical protein